MVRINASGAVKGLNKLIAGIEAALKAAALEIAREGAKVARAQAPEDTGRLKRSIVAGATSTGAFVKVGAPYAQYLPDSYMVAAGTAMQNQAEQIAQKHLKKLL